MNYRKIPKLNLKVSEVSFGCMSLDLNSPDNEKLLRAAFDQGINYFDTADLYNRGANEKLVGKALELIRNQVIIATKVGNEWLPDGSSWRWNPSKNYILKAIDKSLERLQTDYIDIYQLHGGTIEDNRHEVIEAFEELQEVGKIRHYGISSIRPNVINAYAQESDIVNDMLQYSLLDRRAEEQVLELLEKKQVAVMVRGALGKGLLAGKPGKDYLNYSIEEVELIQETLQELSTSDRNLAQTALRFVLSNQAVTTAVVGIRSLQQLTEVVRASDSPGLTQDEYDKLSTKLTRAKYEQHRI